MKKINLKLSRSGSKNGMFGVHRFGEKNPFYGRKHSEETKQKIRIKKSKDNKIKKNCEICSKEFVVEKHRKLTARYCDNKCYLKFVGSPRGKLLNAERQQGDKSWRWKGGRVSLQMQIRTCWKNREWRDFVFKRDNYSCQECGKMGNLHAHHLIRFSSLLDNNNIISVEQALNCEELWDINNGITLCKICHMKKDRHKNK